MSAVFFPLMSSVANQASSGHAFALANLLTYARILAVPAVVAAMYWQDVLEGGLWLRWVALGIFVAAAITDILDGYVARAWGQQSRFGRMLDPIADKLLVASCLLMLAADSTIRGWSLWAAIVILCREILVSGLREYLAELRVSVPVTRLAKWKTTLQLVAIGFLLAGDAGDQVGFVTQLTQVTSAPLAALVGHQVIAGLVTHIGLTLLWLSALLTLYTGWDYFRAGVRHLID
jgi:cardiolipin synthase